ncbi:NAD(P)-binding protein, partial [Staphylococcus haemolyticus]
LQHVLSEDYLDEEKQKEFKRWLQSQV